MPKLNPSLVKPQFKPVACISWVIAQRFTSGAGKADALIDLPCRVLTSNIEHHGLLIAFIKQARCPSAEVTGGKGRRLTSL